jgi:3-dehydroquinate synthase
MQRLTVASRMGDYEVVAEPGALSRLGELMDERGLARPRSLVSNTTVGPLWAAESAAYLECALVELDDGEEHKRWPSIETLLSSWLDLGLHRGDAVTAVGGGVLTDTVGFAAAVYLRGIAWTAVPTTLLAMVDASVGGKTGINLEQGKNLVGSFWPPRLVVVDVETLETLPERELRAGAAEVIKTAWIGDHGLLDLLPEPLPSGGGERWQEVVMRCLGVKARVVSQDELEGGRRAALNLGHTLGHALEAATGYRHFLHGEAVAWGLLAAARLGVRHGTLSPPGAQRLGEAVAALGPIPPIREIDGDTLRELIGRDKKRDGGGVAWVLPTDDGVVTGQRVETDEAIEVFRELQGESRPTLSF